MKKTIHKIRHHFKARFDNKNNKSFEAQGKPNNHKKNIIKLILATTILILLLLIIAGKNKSTAEILIDEFVEAFKGKLGFEYSSDPLSDYVFSKDTPNYNAFAADKKLEGSHRIMLERNGVIMEVKFKSAGFTSKNISGQSDDLNNSSESSKLNNPIQKTIDNLNSELEEITTGLQDISQKITDLEQSVSEVVSKGKIVPENNERIVVFEDAVFGTDLNYRLKEEGIEQKIILKDSKKINNVFRFILNIPDFSYEDAGKGVWYFKNNSNNIMRIPKAYATDGDGKFTNDVEIEVKTTLLVTIMTVKVPHEWLEEKARVYPVTIRTAFEIVPSLRDGTSKPFGNSLPTQSTAVTESTSSTVLNASDSAVTSSSNSAELEP